MITELRIRRLGVISEADVALDPGMVAFTGETGAGKTLVVSALGLILGDRAESTLASQNGTEIEACLEVEPDGPVARSASRAGAVVDGGQLILATSIGGTGRRRAFAGGRSVPVGVLAEIGVLVADRHGQNDQAKLRRPREQRDALDRFAGSRSGQLLERYRSAYQEYVTLSGRVGALASRQSELARESAAVRAGLAEIEAVDPGPEEDLRLEHRIGRLANAETWRQALIGAGCLLRGGPDPAPDGRDATTSIAGARDALRRIARDDAAIGELADRLGDALDLITDVATEVAGLLASLDVDPAELERLQQRKAELTALTRKYGGSCDSAREWATAARDRLGELDPDGVTQVAMKRDLAELADKMADLAGQVSLERSAAAERLASAVTRELRELAMPSARLEVEVTQRIDPSGLLLPDGRRCAFGANGVDVVRILLSPHPGAPPGPLGEIASGGEMSRVMLALEVVLAGTDPPGVFIFDEVDAGIGGRAAIEVGRRLARLARDSQVIVVTHLPQVASFADQQIVVRKDGAGRVTTSTVSTVSGIERCEELSRMLSGLTDSGSALEHAEELLDLAARERAAGDKAVVR